MNLNVHLGKDISDNNVSLDLGKEHLNLILLVGTSGSGKSVFHSQIYKELIKQNTPNELGFMFIDNTRIDFNDFPQEYTIKKTIDNQKAFRDFEYIAQEVEDRNSRVKKNDRALFVHIEECDQFASDPTATEHFYKSFIQYKNNSNVYVIYSTSRPDVDGLPDWLLANADLKVVFNLASETDCQRLTGNNMPLDLKTGEKILITKNNLVACKPLTAEECQDITNFQ